MIVIRLPPARLRGRIGRPDAGMRDCHTFRGSSEQEASTRRRPVVLAFSDYYRPGFKGGGAPQALANLVERLGEEFEFLLVTRDRDVGDPVPYPHVEKNVWTRIGKALVWYLPAKRYSVRRVVDLMRKTPCDVLYFNSLFSRKFTLVPLSLWRLGLSRARSVVLAPRGELGRGALSLKPYRKLVFLRAARILGVLQDVSWQASSAHEKADIERWFPGAAVRVAPDLPSVVATAPCGDGKVPKVAGELRLVFLSRIARVKNLKQALLMLRPLRGDIAFDIYGPQEDPGYWAECERAIETLPPNIRVQYRGAVQPEAVPRVLRSYHLFYFPTLGENFSHAILEALASGCPVLTSDCTPWRGLESVGAGWDIPLEDTGRFVEILQQCADMGAEEFGRLSDSARLYGIRKCDARDSLESNLTLLTAGLNGDAGQ